MQIRLPDAAVGAESDSSGSSKRERRLKVHEKSDICQPMFSRWRWSRDTTGLQMDSRRNEGLEGGGG